MELVSIFQDEFRSAMHGHDRNFQVIPSASELSQRERAAIERALKKVADSVAPPKPLQAPPKVS